MDRGDLSNFLFGLGIGVGVGMLFAPYAGAETRDRLMERADEGKEYLKQRTAGIRESAGGLVERGREVMSRQKDTIHDAMEAGKQAYRETVGQRPGEEMAG
ncbi:MAG: YtxH domain-containing protein [Acidobacteria bacterium]|nr:YtxH domain-containing protein [Acidobacteriota bacterium]